MKTLCLRKGRNMFRIGFDPRGPKNNDEHILGSPCVRRLEHAYTCLSLYARVLEPVCACLPFKVCIRMS